MKDTRVDDVLLSMITAEADEIQENFAKGEKLSKDDLTVLFLKSQYNHMNHLDIKLDEVSSDVSTLKTDFKFLEERLNNKFDSFKNEIKADVTEFKTEIKADMVNLKNDMNSFKNEMKADMTSFKSEIKSDIGQINLNIESLKTDLQKTLTGTIKWFIAGAGILVLSLKLLDMFVK